LRTAPLLSYVVCTAPRTGSSLLCGTLERTGVAGRPQEYFDVHPHNEAFWRGKLGVEGQADYLRKAIAAGTTDNGVFGLKVHWHQTPSLRAKLLADDGGTSLVLPPVEPGAVDDSLHDLLTARLGTVRYIWLRRRNSVAQAISYYRASQTDIWRLPAKGVAAPPTKPVAFDYDEIHRHVGLVQSFDRAWYAYFMQRKLQALIVIYEDFIQTYDKTLRGVLRYLGQQDQALAVPDPLYRRQSDALSAEWERRYLDILKFGPEPRYTPGRAPRPDQPKRAAAKQAPLPMVAYDLGSGIRLKLDTASPARPWMDATPKRFAYRCLPLVIANQAGWMIQNSHALSVEWDGSEGTDGLKITYDEPVEQRHAESHFGSGILTFSVGYLFRTPPGWNLHVRGPVNWPKDGVCALDGIVETDWTHSTFTMNWKLTRPGHVVRFAAGEPIAMISPIHRGDVERFRPEIQPLAADRAWQNGYTAWSTLRTTFNAALKSQRPEAVAAGWQRHYLLGLNQGDVPAPEHQTALAVAPFADRRVAR
jgi:LPS sulfotransferase NodH